MKHLHLSKLHTEAQKVRLSSDEKAALRARVYAVTRSAPAARPQPSYFSFQFAYVRYAMVAFLIVMLAGGSTVSAAAGALPGDVLYPVKINVNEAVQGALAVSSEAKAAFHTQVANLRLEEAETLLARGALTAHAEDTIEQNFEQHASEAKELSAKLQDSDPGAAAEVETQLSSSLSAHSAILDQLKDESSDAQVKKESGDLALFVRSHRGHALAAKAAAAPMALSLSATESASTSQPGTEGEGSSSPLSSRDLEVAQHLQEKAAEALAEAREDFSGVAQKLSPSTLTRLNGEFSALDAAFAEGSTSLAAGDTSAATQDFTGVLQGAVKLEVFFGAQQKFKDDFLFPLLGERSDHSGRDENTDDSNTGKGSDDGGDRGEGGGNDGSSRLPPVDINLQL